MRFLLITIMLSYIWMWLFKKIVVEKPTYLYITLDPKQIYNSEPIVTEIELPRPDQNPLVTLWFSTFTYLIADLWRIWLRAVLRIDPVFAEFEEDEWF